MTTTTGSPPATVTASDDLLLAESLVSLSLNTTTKAVARSTPRTPARTAVLFQPACTKHRYIRTRDTSTIVERPERIRAVKTGVAAAYARLETALPAARDDDDDDLDALLSGLSLDANRDLKGKRRARELVDPRGPFDILDSGAVMSVHDPALQYIHSKPNRAPQDVDAAAAQEDQGWESASSSSSAAIPSTSAGPSASAVDSKPPRASTRPVPWPEQLQSLCRASSSLLSSQPSLAPSSSSRASEIPSHLPQGDLYLCPGSEEAIFGALGACCEGVDRIVRGSRESGAGHASAQGSDSSVGLYDRAFVAIRPPGHHCGEANPQGFCFVNNVAVAAAHAHLEHGIDRVVIFDIDLHHGNGTQEIAWRINANAHEILESRERARLDTAAASASRTLPRKSSPRKSGGSTLIKKEEEEGTAVAPSERNPLRVMYASLHDIWSYPCEDGDPSLVSAASLNLNGGHGQFISNVHLEAWTSERNFHDRLYPRYRDGLIDRAADFARSTRGANETTEEAAAQTLVIVSLGCDASEHESTGMSRHGRNVPTSFYRRFALDAVAFARQHAKGKCLTVLEGGYSDRALASASAAFLAGFTEPDSSSFEEEARHERDGWWTEAQLKKLEKACAVAKGRRAVATVGSPATLLAGADPSADPWLARAVEVFAHLEDTAVAPPPAGNSLAATRSGVESDPNTPRQLRDRKPRAVNYAQLADVSPIPSPARGPTAVRRSASASRLRPAKDETPVDGVLPPPPPPPPPVPSVPTAFLSTGRVAATSSESASAAALLAAAFGNVPSTTFIPTSSPSAEDGGDKPLPKPSIRFTWKQGGFGGEPRM
ncbi:hypothetical protein BMF94_1570 [Rhodotorula taiwanensis]|uniref:Histone deacetylase domain-containing protein n=1 Tax=Rhodotorula taiwanensis TaxID=741276 RepID=A0A2S5BF01_9BASI|nr:hypothetical protein BMF94_1570 [Rhodotorula taiwanensis]